MALVLVLVLVLALALELVLVLPLVLVLALELELVLALQESVAIGIYVGVNWLAAKTLLHNRFTSNACCHWQQALLCIVLISRQLAD